MNAEATTRLPEAHLPALSLVTPPRAIRKLVAMLAVLILAIPVMLAIVPWQQNIPASGRVTALDPLDRLQTLPAPVTGRLVRSFIQEGSEVKKGDVLVEMSDQDPMYAARLQQQIEFASDKVTAARDQDIADGTHGRGRPQTACSRGGTRPRPRGARDRPHLPRDRPQPRLRQGRSVAGVLRQHV